MTIATSTVGPIPGAFPNLNFWVTPIYNTGGKNTQEEFEACLAGSYNAWPNPPQPPQIVNGSYGFHIEPQDLVDIENALAENTVPCLTN